jgi:hypothetical protein
MGLQVLKCYQVSQQAARRGLSQANPSRGENFRYSFFALDKTAIKFQGQTQ